MSENAVKVLTRKQVEKLGLDKVSVITADMLDGYTRIGNDAFSWCDKLTTVNIPDSVTSIGDASFYECSGLTSMTIPNSVTRIGDYAFNRCSSLTSIEIPNSVTSIGKMSFYGCGSLSSIEIPNGVTSIVDYAFSCCYSLTSVTIPNSVTSIGEDAFHGCSSLTSIEIPNSVTSIGYAAFSNCSRLASVNIPDSVTSIKTCAFYGCKFKQKDRKDSQGRIIAYKGFNIDMSCRDFRYKEGETYEFKEKPKLCKCGFHACLNPLDCLNYYHGKVGKDVVFHEVYLEDVSAEKEYDSKVVSKKITIGREITPSEMADIASGRK